MTTNFIYIDDSVFWVKHAGSQRILSLTGILVPMDAFVDVREAFHSALFTRLDGRENVVLTLLPELHGNSFLRGIGFRDVPSERLTDELRLAVLQDLVDIIKRFNLKIYRASQHVPSTKDMVRRFRIPFGMDYWYVRALWDLIHYLDQTVLSTGYVIPVMDRSDPRRERALSFQFVSGQIAAAIPAGKQGLVKSPYLYDRNLIGEMFFAESSVSPYIQLADIVGYLRMCVDKGHFGASASAFRSQLIGLGRALEPHIIVESLRVFRIGDQRFGPEGLEYFRTQTVGQPQ